MKNFTIPDGYVFKKTDEDAFLVEPSPSLLWSLPIFIVMLPFTVLPLLFILGCSLFILPVYRKLPMYLKEIMGTFIAFWLLLSARFRLTVHDYNESKDKHAKLYVSPHISLFENVIFIRLLGTYRPVAATFARKVPIFGFFVHATNPIYVERKKGKPSKGVVESLRESLTDTENKHFIFPEGTYTNGKSLLKFKSGAFAVGVPVTPMVCTFTKYTSFWNREESSFMVQLYRVASRWYTPIQVEFLPTYHPSEEEKADPKLYAENIRKMISFHTKRPLSNQGLLDSPNYQQDVR